MFKHPIRELDSRYVLPTLFILFSIFFAYLSFRLHRQTVNSTDVLGPAFLPFVFSLSLGACAIWDFLSIKKAERVVDTWVVRKDLEEKIEKTYGSTRAYIYRTGFLFEIFVLIIIGFYILLMPVFGFLIMTFFLMIMMMMIVGERKIYKFILYPLLTGLSMYYAFLKPCDIALPFLPWD